jgi:hypothetical protein
MKQERVGRSRPTEKAAQPESIEEVPVGAHDAARLGDIDELLDEIDAVLEDQAVLVDYRQRSGQ